jgi:hypothetical protein
MKLYFFLIFLKIINYFIVYINKIIYFYIKLNKRWEDKIFQLFHQNMDHH